MINMDGKFVWIVSFLMQFKVSCLNIPNYPFCQEMKVITKKIVLTGLREYYIHLGIQNSSKCAVVDPFKNISTSSF